MKSITSYFKFNKKLLRKKPALGLVPYAKYIWEGSIVFLILALAGVLLFDANIFFGKIQQLQSAVYDTGVGEAIEGIQDSSLNQAREILKERANKLESSGENLPEKNPFQF
ncbi:MAG: hypothetical protein AAB372_04010 [Patescibacteria group bacterium]